MLPTRSLARRGLYLSVHNAAPSFRTAPATTGPVADGVAFTDAGNDTVVRGPAIVAAALVPGPAEPTPEEDGTGGHE